MARHVPEPDPRSRLEDEGIPDLQNGTPGQQRAVDPQEASVPADRPLALDEFGTTAEEQREGETVKRRLEREEPEEQPEFGATGPRPMPGAEDTGADFGADEEEGGAEGEREGAITDEGGLGPGSDLDTGFEADDGADDTAAAQPEEPSGQVWEEPRPAGRLVAPDEGAHPVDEPDETATEVGPDTGGFSAEESAMRVDPEE
ncbi:hypothetical protein DZF91_17670 [Actinomadura logoneensis]|uniref:DUF5709 domain-containing protein n=1 Tax=Actinomadura logoneensis TaxID=2293572 RepID=A0A372JK99_9ACTN|nr:DUF5709 domain-containing protein [Actinomadura logoneensis]RFU40339.1 hypothetical protein DZF91_17670 [Actinomadura logoneensis]